MKRILLFLFALLSWTFSTYVFAIEVSLSPEEQKLYDLIMQYRADNGLPSIPLSASLTYVAQTHAKDVYYYFGEIPDGCNPHSWSGHGTWTKCDYYPDHRNAEGMWSKPRELTSYQGNGYEIVHYYLPPSAANCTAEGSLRGWQHSSGHNAVIINQGIWAPTKWQAIGIGMYKGVACVWFGKEIDPNKSEVPMAAPQTQVPVSRLDVSISPEEQKLYKLIMEYRAEKGLPSIPLSPSLTYVAQTHAKDVYDYYDEIPTGCNRHSWSEHGTWTKCEYYPDHRNAECAWSKPRELTSYKGDGHEIIHYYKPPKTGICTAEGAINGWKNSPGHNAMMVNLDGFKNARWQAIGIGMYKGVACAWFGKEIDPDKSEVRVVDPQPKPQTQPKPTPSSVEEKKPVVTTTTKSEQKPQKVEKAKPDAGNWLKRYFDYSGFSSLSYFSAGYTYSCKSGSHLVNASLLDFRVSLFSASLLNVEMSVSPFNKRFAYKPNIRIYIPIIKCLAVVPYGGAEIDASYIGTYLDNNYEYDKDKDFYINAIGGIALNTTIARHVPMEIKVEYRHPFLVPTSGALNPQGIYLGAQIYFGSTFKK